MIRFPKALKCDDNLKEKYLITLCFYAQWKISLNLAMKIENHAKRIEYSLKVIL